MRASFTNLEHILCAILEPFFADPLSVFTSVCDCGLIRLGFICLEHVFCSHISLSHYSLRWEILCSVSSYVF